MPEDEAKVQDVSLQSNYLIITLPKAREFTGLDLVCASEIPSERGPSYHQMELESESKTHRVVREESINFFRCMGYHVFPEGVGIRGVQTLSDFVAIRGKRAVFVEVLSDGNIKEETLRRKAQLQRYGELCFVLLVGTKRSNESELVKAKRSIEDWADVLYCPLNRHGVDSIQNACKATIAYETTRQTGILVELNFEREKRKLKISSKFLTMLYGPPDLPRPSYPLPPASHCHEIAFREIFQKLAQRAGCQIRSTSRHSNKTDFRAMRRKSGLKMINSSRQVAGTLTSEYRGIPMEENDLWTYHPSLYDVPPANVFGVFQIERNVADITRELISVMIEYGLKPQYDTQKLASVLQDY